MIKRSIEAEFACQKELIEAASGSVKLSTGDPEIDRELDVGIVASLSEYYDDVDERIVRSHIPLSSGIQPSLGFSSIAKWAHTIYSNNTVVGKVVVTAKRNGSFKIGPIYIAPKHRQCGYAATAMKILTSSLLALPSCQMTYATVSQQNLAGRRLFATAGYAKSHILERHYNDHDNEIVYIYVGTGKHPISTSVQADIPNIKLSRSGLHNLCDACTYLASWTSSRFFPVDSVWMQWLKEFRSPRNPSRIDHEVLYIPSYSYRIATLLIYKLGGTLKVILAQNQASQKLLKNMLEQIKEKAVSAHLRKASISLPSASIDDRLLETFSFFDISPEAVIPAQRYSVYEPIELFSVFFR